MQQKLICGVCLLQTIKKKFALQETYVECLLSCIYNGNSDTQIEKLGETIRFDTPVVLTINNKYRVYQPVQ